MRQANTSIRSIEQAACVAVYLSRLDNLHPIDYLICNLSKMVFDFGGRMSQRFAGEYKRYRDMYDRNFKDLDKVMHDLGMEPLKI